MFEIEFKDNEECTAKYLQLCKLAQLIDLPRIDHIFQQQDNKIIFLKSALHCGVLFPSFFKSLPIISDKIEDQKYYERRNARGRHTPQEISNIVVRGDILNLRNHDLTSSCQPYQQELVAEAVQNCSHLPTSQFQLGDRENPTNIGELVALLGSNQGFVVGEVHSHISSKNFLIGNFDAFRAQGFSLFYCEHLLADDHQELLDYWHEHPEEPMPRELELYLHWLDRTFEIVENYPDNFYGLIQIAHEKGFRVIAVDNSQTYVRVGHEIVNYDYVRCSLLNSHTVSTVRQLGLGQDCPDNKYIIFCGSAHLGTRRVKVPISDPQRGMVTINGIDKLLSIPSVVVTDQAHSHQQITTDVDDELTKIKANFFHLQTPPHKRFDVANIHVLDHAAKAYLDKIVTDGVSVFIMENTSRMSDCVLDYLLPKVNKLDDIFQLIIHFSCDSRTPISIIRNLSCVLEIQCLTNDLPLDQIYLLLLIECTGILKHRHNIANGFNEQTNYLFQRSLEFNIQHHFQGDCPTIPSEFNEVNLRPLCPRWFPECEVVRAQKIVTLKEHLDGVHSGQVVGVLEAATQFCDLIAPPKSEAPRRSCFSFFKQASPQAAKVDSVMVEPIKVERLRRTIKRVRDSRPEYRYAGCRAILHILYHDFSDLRQSTHAVAYDKLISLLQSDMYPLCIVDLKAEIKHSKFYRYIQSCSLNLKARMMLHAIDGAATFLELTELVEDFTISSDYQSIREGLLSGSPDEISMMQRQIQQKQEEFCAVFGREMQNAPRPPQ
jgi:hypothetical protein